MVLFGQPASRRRFSGFAALILVVLLPLVAAGACLGTPLGSGPVAAVFPPWWTGARAYAAAGTAGAIVRGGALPFILVVAAADRARLRAAGAWLLIDPRAVGGCARPDPVRPS